MDDHVQSALLEQELAPLEAFHVTFIFLVKVPSLALTLVGGLAFTAR